MREAGFIQTETLAVSYQTDPTAVFAALCGERTETLLLESAEIQSKNSLKSLLVLGTAVKICCDGRQVVFEACTTNGRAVLTAIFPLLEPLAKNVTLCGNRLTAVFAPIPSDYDEDRKLQSPSVFDALRHLIHAYRHSPVPVFLGGLFAYDLVAGFMPMTDIQLADDGLTCPDYVFYLAETLLTFDHQTKQAQLQTFCFDASEQENLHQSAVKFQAELQALPPFSQPPLSQSHHAAGAEIAVNFSDSRFKALIDNLKQHIYQGDVFQIVPSRRFSLPCPNPLRAYRRLKQTNPSPYMFFMQDADFTLFGASPESALKYTAHNRRVEIYPIAGSRPRGFDAEGNIDPDLDARLELALRLDKKELAEHLMLVDLARNDVARVSESGSRQVCDLMQIDRYSHIMHLVSRVVGRLRPELDALHAYQACMNMGTLTGAPKIKAMQLIYRAEGQKRHSYGGAVGYFTSDGYLDTCIVIRSAFVQHGIAHIQAGCGTVLDSDPQAEADETRHKAQAVLNAVVYANQPIENC